MQDNNKVLRRKVRNSYIVSTVSIALVLFLLGTVGYLILNAVGATNRMKESIEIHVMLVDGLDSAQQKAVGVRLNDLATVHNTKFVSKADAAAEYIDKTQNNFMAVLEFNPLPDGYDVTLNAQGSEPVVFAKLVKDVGAWSEVDEVVYQKGVVEQIGVNISKFLLVILMFGGTLLVISLILLNNTIRVSIYSKRYLINTMKLVGATQWFILRPFLWASVWQGVQAGVIAMVMFVALMAGLREGFADISFIFDQQQIALILVAMLVTGLLISITFTLVAVRKFVRMPVQKIHYY